jgi:hypothetical protein
LRAGDLSQGRALGVRHPRQWPRPLRGGTGRGPARAAGRTDTGWGTDFGLGIEVRSPALVSSREVAEGLYREAIDALDRTQLRPELARAHLPYGEWLRRENRRPAGGEQLRTAHEMLATMDAEAFAERAGRDLLATGETVRMRTVEWHLRKVALTELGQGGPSA